MINAIKKKIKISRGDDFVFLETKILFSSFQTTPTKVILCSLLGHYGNYAQSIIIKSHTKLVPSGVFFFRKDKEVDLVPVDEHQSWRVLTAETL